MSLDRPLSKEQIAKLERRYRGRDVEAERHNVPSYRGSIESIEEARFPWLKKRRRQRER